MKKSEIFVTSKGNMINMKSKKLDRELKIIEKWYPQKLSEEEEKARKKFSSLHKFQYWVSKKRRDEWRWWNDPNYEHYREVKEFTNENDTPDDNIKRNVVVINGIYIHLDEPMTRAEVVDWLKKLNDGMDNETEPK